jgi:lysine 2,3-aminomutase
MSMEAILHSLPPEWTDWKWQQRNAVRTVEHLRSIYPGLAAESIAAIENHTKKRRFQATQYYLSLVGMNQRADAPLPGDPLWLQVAPLWTDPEGPLPPDYYDGATENWEVPEDMVTPIAQRKYDNRIIIRYANICHSYCQFCYEALRTLEREPVKPSFSRADWELTLEYLKANSDVEEVILSGGEPLMHADDHLAGILGDLRALDRSMAIRIHTRSLTYNPFRITPGLADIVRAYEVTAFGLHVTHPNELTGDFMAGVRRLQSAVPILFSNTPLLRGINDDENVMHDLGMRLYRAGVTSGYLYHFMPNSPGSTQFRTRIDEGVKIIRALKRRVTNLAVPEFVLPHHTGKHSMPLLARDESPPRLERDQDGRPVLRYTNWRGESVTYPDADLPGD